jgi:tetratricopeptide (TPR) repeat protein
MNDTGAFSKALSDVMALWEDEKYDRALKRVEELRESWPGNPQLRVMWAKLVQLTDKPTHSLIDAKRVLQQAIELDKQSPAAAIELGHLLDNVEDDPQAASKSFAQGIVTARHLLIEGLLGQAKSLMQLDKRDEAVRCLVEAHQLADADRTSKKNPFAGRIEELLTELGQMQSV